MWKANTMQKGWDGERGSPWAHGASALNSSISPNTWAGGGRKRWRRRRGYVYMYTSRYVYNIYIYI